LCDFYANVLPEEIMFLYLRESYTNKEKELNAIKLHKNAPFLKVFTLIIGRLN